jgi:hypothetical protein
VHIAFDRPKRQRFDVDDVQKEADGIRAQRGVPKKQGEAKAHSEAEFSHSVRPARPLKL